MNLNIDEMLNFLLFSTILVLMSIIIYTGIGIFYFFVREHYISKELNRRHTGKYLMKIFYGLGYMLLFDMGLKFISTYMITVKGYQSLFESAVYINSLETQTNFPFKSVVITMTACSALYTGFEGMTSVLTNMKHKTSDVVKLPYHKRLRAMYMVYIWFYVAVVGTIYNFFAGGENDAFFLGEIFAGLGLTATALFAADRAPKVASQITVGEKSVLYEKEKSEKEKCEKPVE